MKKTLLIALLFAAPFAMAGGQTSGQSSQSGGSQVTKVESGSVSGSVSQGGSVGNTTAGSTGNQSSTGNVTNVIEASVIPTETTTNVNQTVSGGTNSTVRQEFGTQKIKNTPSVSGAPLVSSNDTCMGSASGAVNVPGFGIGLGKTYTDSNCVMLKNSRELWNMGMKAAAMALMCTDAANREALELTGFECPQTTREKQRNAPTAAAQAANEPTDPIIRSRLGLPPLK